jgi:hypothetical protein
MLATDIAVSVRACRAAAHTCPHACARNLQRSWPERSPVPLQVALQHKALPQSVRRQARLDRKHRNKHVHARRLPAQLLQRGFQPDGSVRRKRQELRVGVLQQAQQVRVVCARRPLQSCSGGALSIAHVHAYGGGSAPLRSSSCELCTTKTSFWPGHLFASCSAIWPCWSGKVAKTTALYSQADGKKLSYSWNGTSYLRRRRRAA